jgi:hypothetical protein
VTDSDHTNTQQLTTILITCTRFAMPFSPAHLLNFGHLKKHMDLQNCIVELCDVQNDFQGHNLPAQIHRNPPTSQKIGQGNKHRTQDISCDIIFPVRNQSKHLRSMVTDNISKSRDL